MKVKKIIFRNALFRTHNNNIHLFIIKLCAEGQQFHKETQFLANLTKSNSSDQKGEDDDSDSLEIKKVQQSFQSYLSLFLDFADK
jgi:hypothetical protein